MSNEEDSKNKAGLVSLRPTALLHRGAASLASRGLQDLLPREEADQWYTRGCHLWNQESYEDAFECFERGIAINPDHTGLQCCLGNAYMGGLGVLQDLAKAWAWFRRAAGRACPNGQFGLGWIHQYVFRHHDYSIAAAWYFLAAEQGHARAAFELGSLYEVGLGVGQDYAHAEAYYRQAAGQGDERAQQALDGLLRKIKQVTQGAETSNEYRQPLWKDRSEDNERRCVFCNTPFSALVVCYREHLKACAQAEIAAKGAKADMAEIVAGEYGDYGCPYHDAEELRQREPVAPGSRRSVGR